MHDEMIIKNMMIMKGGMADNKRLFITDEAMRNCMLTATGAPVFIYDADAPLGEKADTPVGVITKATDIVDGNMMGDVVLWRDMIREVNGSIQLAYQFANYQIVLNKDDYYKDTNGVCYVKNFELASVCVKPDEELIKLARKQLELTRALFSKYSDANQVIESIDQCIKDMEEK